MKQLKQIPDNTYTLSVADIAVIRAMAFAFSGDKSMTPKALKVVESLMDQFNNYDNLNFTVWKDN